MHSRIDVSIRYIILIFVGVKSIDVASTERTRIDLGIRSQETYEIQQEFEMLEKLVVIAEKIDDKDEMRIHYEAMKKLKEKRTLVTARHSSSSTKKPKFATPSCTILRKPSNSSSSSSSSAQLAALCDD